MKRLFFVWLLLPHLLGYGMEMPDSIGSYSLQVSERYTTNLIFPFAIFQVDLGTGDVIGKKLGRAENVLLLKANTPHFLPTNVSVYLENGALYSFRVSYSDTLRTFNYMFRGDTSGKVSSPVIFSGPGMDARKMKDDARLLRKGRQFLHVGASDGKVRLVLKSAYLKDRLLWLSFKAHNHSLIDFRPDVMRFSIEDRKRVKRTAVQSIGITPVYNPQGDCLAGGSQNMLAVAFTPFTIVPGKNLVVDWSEPNGGRRIRLLIKGRELLRVRNYN